MAKHLHWQKWLIMALLTTSSHYLFSQTNISGLWVGHNTQESDGSYSSKYDFEIYLNQKDNFIIGRSYATVGDIYAEMEIVGEIKDDIYFHFQETKIIDFKAEDGMEWCVKKGKLKVVKEEGRWTLQGTWQGNTSFSSCIPGKVFLNKVEPRA